MLSYIKYCIIWVKKYGFTRKPEPRYEVTEKHKFELQVPMFQSYTEFKERKKWLAAAKKKRSEPTKAKDPWSGLTYSEMKSQNCKHRAPYFF